MKNRVIMSTGLLSFVVFLASIIAAYTWKNNIREAELSYFAEVSMVKYEDNNNADLLSSVLKDSTSKEREDIIKAKEEKKQEEADSSKKDVTAAAAQPQRNESGGTVIDGLKTIENNNQVILVTASGYGTSIARIRTFEKVNGRFTQLIDVSGYIGKYGFAKVMSESGMSSPRGRYSIGIAFGRFGNPGTKLSFRDIEDNDYWVDDSNSSLYNTWQTGSANGRWSSAEKMNIAAYNYGFVINYNTDQRTPGLGSAIFFHVSSSYTAGCTGTSQENVIQILKWLDPSKNPIIIQCPESELGNY